MTTVADDRLEAKLREVLRSMRPGSAPPELRASIDAIPAHSRPGRVPTTIRTAFSMAGGLAGLAIVTVVGVLAVSRLANVPAVPYVDPGSGGSVAPPPLFDPSIEGLGIVSSVATQQASVPWMLAVLGWIMLAAIVIAIGRRRRVAALLVALVVGLTSSAAAFGVSTHPGLQFGNAWGPVLGLDASSDPSAGSGDSTAWYVTAEPGAPFALVFQIHNPGPLPLRYLGVVEPNPPGVHFPRWSAVWQVDGGLGIPAAEAASAFHAVDIPPDGRLTLYLVGRASDCAFGPNFRRRDEGSYAYSGRSTVEVAYSLLGLTASSEVQLPVTVAEPTTVGGCPPG